jgi:hypothetical protein
MVMKAATRVSIIGLFVVLAGGGGIVGYKALRSDVVASVYRQRLHELAGEYETLRSRYNEAVRRTAVTELVVSQGHLCVRVRNVDGVVQTFDTPFDPSGEIYCDYVVRDGRVWIRRVFDDETPPVKGVVIDPELAEVDWASSSDQDEQAVGKAVYRALSEGRWVVTVTGDGSLGLRRVGDADGALADDLDLARGPEVKKYEEIEARARAEAESIGWREVWGALWGASPSKAGGQ